MQSYSAQAPTRIKGPCVVCGMTDYALSMGGPNICPACDCGISPTDKRHPKNLMPASAQVANVPVLLPATRDELLLAAVEQILRELQTLNTQVAQIQVTLLMRGAQQSFEGAQLPQR